MKTFLKKYLTMGVFLFTLFTITNCEDNQLEVEPELAQIDIVSLSKNWLESHKSNLIILKYTKTIDWANAIITQNGNEYAVEIPLILKDGLSTKFGNSNSLKSYHRLLFIISDLTLFNLYHVQITTTDLFNNIDRTINYFSLEENFTGYISVLDANNQKATLSQYNNGEKFDRPEHLLTGKVAVTCTYIGWWYEDGRFEPIMMLHCEGVSAGSGEENEYGGGSGSGSGGVNASNELTEEEFNDFLTQDVWDTQKPYDDWNSLTQCEKDFFSVFPPFLYNAHINRTLAENSANNYFPNCDQHNDIADAFRHAYFSALNTQSMGYYNAKILGNAHECDTPMNLENEKNMDLHNNSWGYQYASTNSYFTTEQFYNAFAQAHNNNEIVTLKTCY